MRKEKFPFISIITLNWNTTALTCEFLESTRRLNYQNYEILVCDMDSDSDPSDQINANHYPHTKVLRSEKNLGFSGGNNFGIRQAKGEYIFIINNDTELTPEILDVLLEPFDEDPLVGVTCPKIRFFSQPRIIQYAGFKPMNLFTGRTKAIGFMEEDKGQYDMSGYTAGAHGCAMMVKKEVIIKTGMFPENFFLYYEEWDWSLRIQKAGYRIFYQAKGLVYHKESMTVGKQNPVKTYYHTRNRVLFMRRNTSPFHLLVFTCFFTLFTIPRSVIQYTFKRQFRQLRYFFKAVMNSMTMSKNSLVY